MQITTPYIIDVEASGFGEDSYPIEVGIALEPGHKYCTLIRPVTGWQHWDEQAAQVHGISREELTMYGRPVTQVADELNRLLKGKTVFSDGWVVDKPWVSKIFYAARKPMLFQVSPLEMILKEPQMQHWHETMQQLHEQAGITRHRASNDAWLIQQTYERTRQQPADKTA